MMRENVIDTKLPKSSTIPVEHKLARIRFARSVLEREMEACNLCPRACNANRTAGPAGYCFLSSKAKIYRYKLHFGEEPPISGTRGSGIIFFSGCTMRCVFRQNYPMSHLRQGYEVTPEILARIMLQLQEYGAHNINLVTPGQFLPQILTALEIALEKGLHLPLVYNTNGYEKPETLRLLDGIIDVYLPDAKYASDALARRYSRCPNYVAYNHATLKEMFRQVGLLETGPDGLARCGLIVRHLVLPNQLENTRSVLKFIAEELSPEVSISLMTQYLPIWGAKKYPEINRRITPREMRQALDWLEEFGLEEGWYQEL